MRQFLFIVIIGMCFRPCGLYSQSTDKSKNTSITQSYFHVKLSHSTDAMFLGRTDSVQTPTNLVEFGYNHKSGLFVLASMEYLPNRIENKLDAFNLTGGYNFNIVKDLISASVTYSHVFYNPYSTQVSSEISGILSGDISLDWDPVRMGLNTTLNFGETTDLLISPSIGHDFTFEKLLGGNLTVGSTITLSSGTQKLYALYKANRANK